MKKSLYYLIAVTTIFAGCASDQGNKVGVFCSTSVSKVQSTPSCPSYDTVDQMMKAKGYVSAGDGKYISKVDSLKKDTVKTVSTRCETVPNTDIKRTAAIPVPVSQSESIVSDTGNMIQGEIISTRCAIWDGSSCDKQEVKIKLSNGKIIQKPLYNSSASVGDIVKLKVR